LVGAFAFAGASVWAMPILCGAIGLVFALVALARGERLARIAIPTVVVATVLGLLLHQLPPSFFT
jgi:hypothetical protein